MKERRGHDFFLARTFFLSCERAWGSFLLSQLTDPLPNHPILRFSTSRVIRAPKRGKRKQTLQPPSSPRGQTVLPHSASYFQPSKRANERRGAKGRGGARGRGKTDFSILLRAEGEMDTVVARGGWRGSKRCCIWRADPRAS